MKLVDCIRRGAALWPERPAVSCGDRSLSYGELYSGVSAKATELAAGYGSGSAAIPVGTIIPLRAFSSVDFVVEYLAIHLAGAVAAPLDKDLPEQLYLRYVSRFKTHRAPAGAADVLLTTGTTAIPKEVVISHDALMAGAENLVDAQGYSSALTFIINGPLSHIGSLSKLYSSFFAGASVCLVDGMKDLNVFFNAVEAAPWKAATFLVPTAIRMILTFAAPMLASLSDKIDFIETGAAPISKADAEGLCRVLPHSRLYNTYASTETGIISTFNYNSAPCLHNCLGLPMAHSSFAISPEGRVICRGDTLMTGYLQDERMEESEGGKGEILTSDLGELDAMGRLFLRGRADDVINIGGFKVDPSEVEDAALTLSWVTDCICTTIPHPFLGRALKLLVVTKGPLDEHAIVQHLSSRLESYKVPGFYEKVPGIRRNANGKLDRKAYYSSETL